jgi:Family of unknown function (DUF5677)
MTRKTGAPKSSSSQNTAEPKTAQLRVRNVLSRIEVLESYINDLTVIPSTSYVGTAVLLALLSKSLTVSRAICELIGSGFPAEAFGLTRTLVELYLTIHYIANKDTEARAKTYVEYFAKVHAEWGEINAKYYPGRKLVEPAFHDEAMKIAEKFKNKHAWTGIGGQTRMMAFEEDTVDISDDGKPFKSDFDYEVIYFWTSHFVHGTVAILSSFGVWHKTIRNCGNDCAITSGRWTTVSECCAFAEVGATLFCGATTLKNIEACVSGLILRRTPLDPSTTWRSAFPSNIRSPRTSNRFRINFSGPSTAVGNTRRRFGVGLDSWNAIPKLNCTFVTSPKTSN